MSPFRDTLDYTDLTTSSDLTYSTTEDSAEHGFAKWDRAGADPVTYQTLGRAEGLDFDGIGDIADEGRGHRG